MVNPVIASIYLVTDIGTASAARQMPSTRIVSLTEEQEYMCMIPDAVVATVLLPPYESMMFLSDGDYNTFKDVYMGYLTQSAEVNMFLAIIMRSVLIEGNNIVIFVPRDEMELGFFQVFAEYLTVAYGVVIGTDTSPFMYNPQYDGSNCEIMYMNNFMSYHELLVNFPQYVTFSPQVVSKLVTDMGGLIPLKDASIEEYSLWLYDYKERIKQNNNMFLQRGLIRL